MAGAKKARVWIIQVKTIEKWWRETGLQWQINTMEQRDIWGHAETILSRIDIEATDGMINLCFRKMLRFF